MKKKLLSVLLIDLVLALGMQTEVYAAEDSEMYTGISSITSTMGIYDSVLDFSVDVETRGSEYADAAVALGERRAAARAASGEADTQKVCRAAIFFV